MAKEYSPLSDIIIALITDQFANDESQSNMPGLRLTAMVLFLHSVIAAQKDVRRPHPTATWERACGSIGMGLNHLSAHEVSMARLAEGPSLFTAMRKSSV